MKLKQTGSVFINHGLWYYAVQLPGEKRRRQVPLRAPGANHTLTADRPRKMAEDAAARYWQENTRQIVRHEPTGATVEEICERWAVHAREYYHGEYSAENAILDVRLFREMFGRAALAELTHADMLKLRDALIRSGLARRTVNSRLWRVKFMLEWALDEALIPAVVKAELTQVKGVKRGRSAARETPPVHPIDDATVEATLACLTPNTADMVRVQRLTGMRPCELCAMRWALIDQSHTPWIYRVPPEVNKNGWRGEFGQPRVVCIGPKARQILEKYRGGDAPFSPVRAMTEYLAAKRAARTTPFYGRKKDAPEPSVPREIGDVWDVHAYRRAIARACDRAKIHSWGPNRLRHTFGTEVRRRFGLEACRAVLGHTMGGCVTDIYSFGAIEDEMIEKASPAVEALG
ncbi:MAG: tyrosine-type recombinase/integrase [Kiritimatiellae bacterium]|nr:tyrosine-type recombinase/integrase [Kiritimatiellia bacterium]